MVAPAWSAGIEFGSSSKRADWSWTPTEVYAYGVALRYGAIAAHLAALPVAGVPVVCALIHASIAAIASWSEEPEVVLVEPVPVLLAFVPEL